MTRLILLLISATHLMAQEVKPTVLPKKAAAPSNAIVISLPKKTNAPLTAAITTAPSVLPTVTSGQTGVNPGATMPGAITPQPATTAPGGVAPSDVAGPSPYNFARPLLIPTAAAAAPPATLPVAPANPMGSMPGMGGGGSPQNPSNPPSDYNRPAPVVNNYYNTPSSGGSVPADSSGASAPTANTSHYSQSLEASTAPACSDQQSLWSALKTMPQEGPLKPSGGYDINSTAWPKLQQEGNSLSATFSGQTSMCTSATATAFMKHIADLSHSGLNLNSQEVAFLNGDVTHNAFNGNTYSVAVLYQALGGQSMVGKGEDIKNVLTQAKQGDVMKFDRIKGTGHSTIFKDVEGDKVCYWSSNTPTGGTGVTCESISSLADVVVSRFPSDISAIPKAIESMMHSSTLKQKFSSSKSPLSASDITPASSLGCSVSSKDGHDGKPGADGAAT